jgi:hypothetical protein
MNRPFLHWPANHPQSGGEHRTPIAEEINNNLVEPNRYISTAGRAGARLLYRVKASILTCSMKVRQALLENGSTSWLALCLASRTKILDGCSATSTHAPEPQYVLLIHDRVVASCKLISPPHNAQTYPRRRLPVGVRVGGGSSASVYPAAELRRARMRSSSMVKECDSSGIEFHSRSKMSRCRRICTESSTMESIRSLSR